MPERRYFPKMVGKKCYLSPINEDDAALYTAWLNDLEVTRTLQIASRTISLSGEREVLGRISKEHTYAIIDRASDALIGNVGLHDVNHLHRTAEIGIFIGDKSFWGRGYGPEAMSLLLAYSFDYLNLRNVMLRAYSFNERGLAAYRRLGFKEIGRRRFAVQREGVESDEVLMDLLDAEFRSARES